MNTTIKRPTISQLENAPINSTLEIWINREVATPRIWIKNKANKWQQLNAISVLVRYSKDMGLTNYYRTILTTKGE